MTYTLWRCSRVSSAGEESCPGFKYLEPDQDPGRCGHVTVITSGPGKVREHSCHGPMHRVGDFTFETHESAASGRQKGAVDAVHTG